MGKKLSRQTPARPQPSTSRHETEYYKAQSPESNRPLVCTCNNPPPSKHQENPPSLPPVTMQGRSRSQYTVHQDLLSPQGRSQTQLRAPMSTSEHFRCQSPLRSAMPTNDQCRSQAQLRSPMSVNDHCRSQSQLHRPMTQMSISDGSRCASQCCPPQIAHMPMNECGGRNQCQAPPTLMNDCNNRNQYIPSPSLAMNDCCVNQYSQRPPVCLKPMTSQFQHRQNECRVPPACLMDDDNRGSYPPEPTCCIAENTTRIARATPLLLGPGPCVITCPNCLTTVETVVMIGPSHKTHMVACAFCILFCLPCVLLPYCLNWYTVPKHFCPSCGKFLGVYRPPPGCRNSGRRRRDERVQNY